MNTMWIPVGSAVAIILLSLGVLEVMSEEVRVDPSSTGARRFWEIPAHPGPAFLDVIFQDHPTGGVQEHAATPGGPWLTS
jgi:hypothetical protein